MLESLEFLLGNPAGVFELPSRDIPWSNLFIELLHVVKPQGCQPAQAVTPGAAAVQANVPIAVMNSGREFIRISEGFRIAENELFIPFVDMRQKVPPNQLKLHLEMLT
jgi:hypothetical protein